MIRRTLSRAFLGAALLLIPSLAPAQELPSADEIIERYVEAIGGRSLVLSITSMQTRGTMAMPAAGFEGSFTLSQHEPDMMRMEISLPGLGEILSGYDGEVGWSVNPVMGASIMEGAELEQTRERAGMAAAIRDRSVIPERETVERSESQGEACWKVRLVWASGRTSHDCYSIETGLLIYAEDVQVSAMGEIPTQILYSDYREFGGMMMPTLISASAMGQQQEMRIQDIQVGGVSESTFDLPPAIRTLIGGN